jgi:hypothetical protein
MRGVVFVGADLALQQLLVAGRAAGQLPLVETLLTLRSSGRSSPLR